MDQTKSKKVGERGHLTLSPEMANMITSIKRLIGRFLPVEVVISMTLRRHYAYSSGDEKRWRCNQGDVVFVDDRLIVLSDELEAMLDCTGGELEPVITVALHDAEIYHTLLELISLGFFREDVSTRVRAILFEELAVEGKGHSAEVLPGPSEWSHGTSSIPQ